MSAERPPFRPDIEGLRGVAILLVVLFHAGVSQLAGGFVGVDLFFVLSGYFITGLLAREIERAGDVDVGAFYASRALRLLPALLVVLLATLGAVTWLYAPIDRVAIAATARAVALSAGNIEFARGSVDYFGTRDNPLLHTWSLAVEEQFYVAWPLLLSAAALFHQGRTPSTEGGTSRRALLAWTMAAGALSLAASLWLTRVAQPWAFFGLPTRIWEFALGAAVALGALDRWTSSPRFARLAPWLQGAGLAALAVAIVRYDRVTPYPGVAALLPALAAAALLLGGRDAPARPASRFLSASPLRWLGRVSYAWYLWHWPLVGLATVLQPGIGVAGKLAWSLAALGLAWLTLRMVEEPARTGALSRQPATRLGLLALGASVAAALLSHGALRAAERVAARPEQRAFAAARVDRMEPGCWVNTVEDVGAPCVVGNRSSPTTIALLGDSHAQHWLAGLDRAGREHGWRVDAMVKGGCPVADLPEMQTPRARRHYAQCTRYREAMLQRIVAMRPRAVILSNWDGYVRAGGGWEFGERPWSQGLRRTYARLAKAGITTIVLRDTPTIPFDAPACLSRGAARVPFAAACTYARRDALSPAGRRAQDAAARGLDVRFIDMNDQVCAAATCGVTQGALIVFTDDDHLTATFSRALAPVLGARVQAALDGTAPTAPSARRESALVGQVKSIVTDAVLRRVGVP